MYFILVFICIAIFFVGIITLQKGGILRGNSFVCGATRSQYLTRIWGGATLSACSLVAAAAVVFYEGDITGKTFVVVGSLAVLCILFATNMLANQAYSQWETDMESPLPPD